MTTIAHSASPKTIHSTRRSPFLDELDGRLAQILTSVQREPFFQEVANPAGDPRLTLRFMREVMLEIWSYQKEIDEAVFAAVGRIGKTIPEQALIRSMIAVQIEETGHGYMALMDYVALGGSEEYARSRLPSPQALAVIAVVRELSFRRNPLAHLGYMYFFEKFTTMITLLVEPYLAAKGYPQDRLGFMKLHAEEDVRHADMLGNVISEALSTYPGAEEAIRYGFECFHAVYPYALWSEAFRRAKEGLK
jgi:pyrroloquinoline quinone (PQQ) biosynthesis protein C